MRAARRNGAAENLRSNGQWQCQERERRWRKQEKQIFMAKRRIFILGHLGAIQVRV